jgi:hypothetical protein
MHANRPAHLSKCQTPIYTPFHVPSAWNEYEWSLHRPGPSRPCAPASSSPNTNTLGARYLLGKCRDFLGLCWMTMHSTEAPGREPASSPSEHSQQSQPAPHQPQAVDSSAAPAHQINPLFTLAPHALGSTAVFNGSSFSGLEAANKGPCEVQDACANQPCVKFQWAQQWTRR